jgi:hypothetical protein
MKALSVRTTIAPDGTIDLHVPSDLPPGEAEVVIVVQPLAITAHVHSGPPFPSDHGVWKGRLPDTDIDADLQEMNRLWEEGMEHRE